jgi:hypothetical protein
MSLVFNGGERATTTNQQVRAKLINVEDNMYSPERRITTSVPG